MALFNSYKRHISKAMLYEQEAEATDSGEPEMHTLCSALSLCTIASFLRIWETFGNNIFSL